MIGKRYSSIVILTGAGISAESGIDTFRDEGGIWSRYDWRDVATPEGFARDPAMVHAFYNERRRGLPGIRPNAAHDALARLDEAFRGDLLLVTQNIDDLHERAGSRRLLHMHGELAKSLCGHCGQRTEWRGDMDMASICPACGTAGALRPDVVWFGEMPYGMVEIGEALGRCDLCVSIGTSGTVYPAAGFVADAGEAGAHTVKLNLEPSDGASLFSETRRGRASELVPAFVDRLLGVT